MIATLFNLTRKLYLLRSIWILMNSFVFIVAWTNSNNHRHSSRTLQLLPSTTKSLPPQPWRLSSTKMEGNERSNRIFYILDPLTERSSDKLFDDVAKMCVDVFFNNENMFPPPWKLVQLNYLAALQSADLKRRSRKSNQDEGKDTNNNKNNNKDDYNIAMFVARRVVPVKSSSPQIAQSTPLILDLESIYPHPPTPTIENSTPLEYVRGEILGFCEVMERPYGLGNQHDDVTVPRGKKLSRINPITGTSNPIRPFLTNLCVRGNARAVGIGGTLVEACEYAVAGWQDDDGRQRREIVLEVEEDNPAALQFYQKRGYEVVFSDPACRRFTTHGLWLTKERCTKVCMRKVIGVAQTSVKPSSDKSSKGNLSKLYQTFYDIVP